MPVAQSIHGHVALDRDPTLVEEHMVIRAEAEEVGLMVRAVMR
jgi:hypothetical protein